MPLTAPLSFSIKNLLTCQVIIYFEEFLILHRVVCFILLEIRLFDPLS
jgi:hypothetical protein